MKIDGSLLGAQAPRRPAPAKPARPFVEVLAERSDGSSSRSRDLRDAGPRVLPGDGRRDGSGPRSSAPAAPSDEPDGASAPDLAGDQQVGPQAETRSRAFGFDELGVLSALGAAVPQAGVPGGPGQNVAATDPAVAEGVRAPADIGLGVSARHAALAPSSPTGEAEAGPVSTIARARGPSNAADGPALAADPTAGAPDAPEAEDTGVGRGASGFARPRPAAAPVHLLVSEQAGQVSIVAAARLTDPEAARLTRDVAELARRFGVGVEEFQLNGEVRPTGPLALQGAVHGRRAR